MQLHFISSSHVAKQHDHVPNQKGNKAIWAQAYYIKYLHYSYKEIKAINSYTYFLKRKYKEKCLSNILFLISKIKGPLNLCYSKHLLANLVYSPNRDCLI